MIYLDNNATTKLDPRVLEAMLPFLKDQFGNAASNHAFGVAMNQHVKEARANVADVISCEPHEIIFTSGATEAINLAIKGVVEQYMDKGKHIVTVQTEHPAVLDTFRYLESKNFEVTYLPVDSSGLVNMQEVNESIREDTILVSVMLVNNETGVIQPIKEIAELAHEKGAFFMTDATQAIGKCPVDVNNMGIDLLTLSGHKFYGPKGVGALYAKSRRPHKVKPVPLIHGGGHERSFRSGTLNVPGIVGIGKAAEIVRQEAETDSIRIGHLRGLLEGELMQLDDIIINGLKAPRVSNTSNICFKGADADAIMTGLQDIMVSNGSACSSAKVEPSHVLLGMGLPDQDAYSSIRFSLGRFTTEEEVLETSKQVQGLVKSLRAMSI